MVIISGSRVNFMKKQWLIFCLIIIFLLSGCNVKEKTVINELSVNENPIVVATIFPIADLLKQIGGEEIEVITLLPAGASPHHFELTPKEAKIISQGELLVSVGAGLDPWAERIAKGLAGQITELVLSDGIDLLPLEREEHQGHSHQIHGKEGDPHIWLDPVLTKEEIAPMLAEILIEKWPENGEVFQNNLLSLQEKLERIHQNFTEIAEGLSERKFISFHRTWSYLGERYNLREVESVLEYPGEEPSAQWLAGLIKLAKQEEISIIFIEPQFNPKPAEIFAQEIGGKVFVLDPLGGENVDGRDDYFKLMQYNFSILQEALK